MSWAINDLYKDHVHKGSWVNEKQDENALVFQKSVRLVSLNVNKPKEVILPPKPSFNKINIIFRHVAGMGMVIVLLIKTEVNFLSHQKHRYNL